MLEAASKSASAMAFIEYDSKKRAVKLEGTRKIPTKL